MPLHIGAKGLLKSQSKKKNNDQVVWLKIMFANEIRLVVQCNVKGSYFFRRYFCACKIPNFCKLNKSVSVVEPLMYDSQDIAKFEFSILSLCVYIFKNHRPS